MALDNSLFGCQIPAATYAVGDIVPMKCIRGPAVVRAGYGAAILKKVFTTCASSTAAFKIVVKNSNWVDSMSNQGIGMAETSLEDNSSNVQLGHDCNLVPNSSWQVYAECITAGTESAASQAFALIDIDFPAVASVKNPRIEQGTPVTIDWESLPLTITASTADPANLAWTVMNVDVFKAGHRYLLDQASFKTASASVLGFIEISGAAGQNGLTRIIPCRTGAAASIKYLIGYSTPLVKGPMNVSICATGTAGSDTCYLYTDWVKR